MLRLLQYYGRFQGLRGTVGGMPSWARALLLIAAIPGIVLMALSIVAFFVSLLALLLLTVPVYRLLVAVTGLWRVQDAPAVEINDVPQGASPGRRHIDVTIVE